MTIGNIIGNNAQGKRNYGYVLVQTMDSSFDAITCTVIFMGTHMDGLSWWTPQQWTGLLRLEFRHSERKVTTSSCYLFLIGDY